MNMRNLERVLAREEEVKKKAIVHKDVYKGPQVRYLSKDGKLSVFSQSNNCFFPQKVQINKAVFTCRVQLYRVL